MSKKVIMELGEETYLRFVDLANKECDGDLSELIKKSFALYEAIRKRSDKNIYVLGKDENGETAFYEIAFQKGENDD